MGSRREPAVVRRARATVEVHRDVEVLQRGPQPVVLGVVERPDPGDVGRDRRQQHAATETVLLDPGRVRDGVVDVVQEDLSDAGALDRTPRAEVHHPAVVGVDPGPPPCVVVGLRGPGEEDEARVEGRHRVGEQHLAHDPVGELVGVAPVVVPVADAQIGVAEVLPRVLVLLAPRVELVAVVGARGTRGTRRGSPPAWVSAEMIVYGASESVAIPTSWHFPEPESSSDLVRRLAGPSRSPVSSGRTCSFRRRRAWSRPRSCP